MFIINSQGGISLNRVHGVSCRLYTSGMDDKEIALFKLNDASSLASSPAFMMGALCRGESHVMDDWNFQIISKPAKGTAPHDNVDDVQHFLLLTHPANLSRDLPDPLLEHLEHYHMPKAKPIVIVEVDIIVPYGSLGN
jgi:hypothetical protein